MIECLRLVRIEHKRFVEVLGSELALPERQVGEADLRRHARQIGPAMADFWSLVFYPR